MGLRGDPPPACIDPALSYLPVDGAARLVHGDLPSMIVGGLASLLLQILHPGAMAGVADHSRYRDDPLGRLEQTATFVGTTTFGSRTDALAAIERVRAVHQAVRGQRDDARPYEANDPELLRWVHVAEISMFLAGARAFSPHAITPDIADRYVAEMATLARDLGVVTPPESERELLEQLEAFRPELDMIPRGKDARNFVLRGVASRPLERAAYTSLVAAALGILPEWARVELELPTIPLVNNVVIRPAATAVAVALRLALPTSSK